MLKYELENLDGLDEAAQAHYAKGDDGKFRLSIEGLPKPEPVDDSGLRKKVDELLAEKKAEADKRKKAEADAQKAAEDAARKAGDVATLEKSWQDKFTTRETELTGEISRRDASLKSILVDGVASSLASELAITGSASVLLPHIRARLAVEYGEDGKPVTRVLDANGKPSAATLDDLKNEFASSKAFAPLIAGTKASGGGATGAGRGGAGVKSMTRSEFESLDVAQKQAFIKGGGRIA